MDCIDANVKFPFLIIKCWLVLPSSSASLTSEQVTETNQFLTFLFYGDPVGFHKFDLSLTNLWVDFVIMLRPSVVKEIFLAFPGVKCTISC